MIVYQTLRKRPHQRVQQPPEPPVSRDARSDYVSRMYGKTMDSVPGPPPMKLEYEKYIAHLRLVVGKYWPVIFTRWRQQSCRYRPLVEICESEEIKWARATVSRYDGKTRLETLLLIKRRSSPAARVLIGRSYRDAAVCITYFTTLHKD